MTSGEKLALIGDNGAGKTTLMKHFANLAQSSDMTFAEQEISSQAQIRLLEDIQSLNPEEKGKFMTLVSCFGSDPKPILSGSVPSLGIWQKMLIAKGIVVGSPMMFLDEPTNHMDLPAIQLLEEALKSYKGILVLVSHDTHFVANLGCKTLRLIRTAGTTKAQFFGENL